MQSLSQFPSEKETSCFGLTVCLPTMIIFAILPRVNSFPFNNNVDQRREGGMEYQNTH